MTSKIGQRLSLVTLGWLLSYPIVLQMSLSSAVAAPIKFKLPPPPSRGIARNRSAAASRTAARQGKCPAVDQPLTALVPEYRSEAGNQVWGLTGMEHPTFLFYVPYPKTSIVSISFTLQDESNPSDTQIVYENLKLVPTQAAGMMAIIVPKSSPPLVANRPYHWFMTLNMNCTIGQRPIFVDGWVQHKDLERDLSAQISQASPMSKVALYAENGLWYDAIATLSYLRSTKPQNPTLDRDWQNLLDSIELGHLASRSARTENKSTQPQPLRGTGF
jgi:Domain of Unknown Function (DUF928)